MERPCLNVGAGLMPRKPNQINADLYPGPNIDVTFDVCQTWPFEDNSIGAVRAIHILEHLPDPFAFFKEAWRVLAPDADYKCNLQLRLPYGASGDAIGDITHLRSWLPGSFSCFQPGYNRAVFNRQYDGWPAPFSVMSVYQRINPKLRWLVKPVIRRWGLPLLEFLWGGYVEMIVGMRALKKPDDVTRWQIRYEANSVPIAHCMYQYHYEGRDLEEGEPARMLFFGPGAEELQAASDGDYMKANKL